MRKVLIAIVAIGVAVYLGVFALLAIKQRALMYFPSGEVVAPASAGLAKAREIHLATADGAVLRAWYAPPAAGKPLILFFHGQSGNIASEAATLQKLTAGGDGLLAIDYRGYPGSTGSPSEAGLLRDGEAAYAKALALGVPPAHIVVIGQSLGTGVAVALAARHPVGALVLDCPYSSTADVAASRYWIFPVRWVMLDQFHSDRRIGQIRAPLLIVHGVEDATIPIRFGRELFALAPQPKTFMAVPGVGHLALDATMPTVLDWIDKNQRH